MLDLVGNLEDRFSRDMAYFVFHHVSEEFLLEDINNYRFLTGGHIPVAGVDDAQEFRLTIEAMNIMGFSPEDQSGILKELYTFGLKYTIYCKSVHFHELFISREVLGPIVQSIVSLTTSLRHQLVKYMLTTYANTSLIFVGKM